MTAERIGKILRARWVVTADPALGLARYIGTDVRSWMHRQHHHERGVAAREMAGKLRAIHPHEVA